MKEDPASDCKHLHDARALCDFKHRAFWRVTARTRGSGLGKALVFIEGMDLATDNGVTSAQAVVLALALVADYGIYLGLDRDGVVFAPRQQCALVLGPPRAGKSSGLAIPNILCANGSVLAVSTKPDLLNVTGAARGRLGPTMLFDPGSSTTHERTASIGWSPLHNAALWDSAVLMAESMVGTVHAGGNASSQRHWSERAAALLAGMFHAAALGELSMRELVRRVNRREIGDSIAALARANSLLAMDLLVGVAETDSREQSGIWSTAAGVLAAYRTEGALASSERPPFDAERFVNERQTLYICATGDLQAHIAPLVAGLIRDIRTAAYRRATQIDAQGTSSPPVLLVLDELANIAPLHDLPSLIAEGGSQGVLTLACLQDLSQARSRWGAVAEGFFSLFGAKVVLPGIGDTRTLEAISLLAGDVDVVQHSSTRSRQRGGLGHQRSKTKSSRRQRRLPPDLISNRRADEAVLMLGARLSRLTLTPAHRYPLWSRVLETSL